jgi:hypothetical protein
VRAGALGERKRGSKKRAMNTNVNLLKKTFFILIIVYFNPVMPQKSNQSSLPLTPEHADNMEKK